jgi:hypothetical protein
MKVIDPGHMYRLDELDGPSVFGCDLTFVQREGDKYPGNVRSYAGTTLQEVWRVSIDRLRYLDNQKPCWQNKICIWLLQKCIYWLEHRAALAHNRTPLTLKQIEGIENLPNCRKCLHIGCEGHCRSKE